MNVIETGDTFNCDCGFSWRRGQSGAHSCGDGLRKKIAALQKDLDALSAKALEVCEEAAHVYQKLNDSVAPDMVCDCQTIHELGLLASNRLFSADATKGASDDK